MDSEALSIRDSESSRTFQHSLIPVPEVSFAHVVNLTSLQTLKLSTACSQESDRASPGTAHVVYSHQELNTRLECSLKSSLTWPTVTSK